MANQIIVFDFDQTLTKIHTFSTRSLDATYEGARAEDHIREGSTDAHANLKEGLKDSTSPLFSFEADHLFCIATYHNNPDYIAGYLQVLLGKTIMPSVEPTKYSHGDDIAIKNYDVDGSDKPLLISFIPQVGPAFGAARRRLTGKNEQICFLEEILQSKFLMEPGALINYYDDDPVNIEKAMALPHVRAHRVDGGASSFKLIGEVSVVARDDVPAFHGVVGYASMWASGGAADSSTSGVTDAAVSRRPRY